MEHAVIFMEVPERMCGETNRELHINTDFWNNSDTGQIFFGNSYSLQITLIVCTVRGDV